VTDTVVEEKVQVSFVPKDLAVEIWPKIRGYINSATERTGGRYEPEDVLYEILDGKLLLWVALEGTDVIGVATSRFEEYPRKKVLMVPFLAGEQFSEWGDDMLSILRKWASDNGCSMLEASGRPGWARVFKDQGYKRLWDWCEVPTTVPTGE
jgi:hypothetical protein